MSLSSLNSLLYDTIYESEVFEDSQDIAPSLVADVQCPEDMDCKIQITVFYSSNKTNNKEVILCGSTFSLREFFLSIQSKNTSTHMITMTSEYIAAAKVYIELFLPFKKVLQNDYLSIHSKKKICNPLLNKYVFYTEDDITYPRIDVLEMSWEPRLTLDICQIFLNQMMDSLRRSIIAWNQRSELERMRQGYFKNTEEALNHSWHELKLSVHSARLIPIISHTADDTPTKRSNKRSLNGNIIDESLPTTCVNITVIDRYIIVL